MFCAHIAMDGTRSGRHEQTCTDHALAVAALAKAYLPPLGLSATGETAGLLHDMGKLTDEFDDYIERAGRGERVRKGSVIHTAFPKDTLLQRARATFSDLCAAAAEREIGMYRLDLPTGGGKTLAVLCGAA